MTSRDVLGRLPANSEPVIAKAATSGESIPDAITLARQLGIHLPQPGVDTLGRWSVLAAVAAVNLTMARVLEAHADAMAILAEAGAADTSGELAFGVFAAEAPDTRLDATTGPDGVILTGVKPWCSIAADLDAALVTAHTPEGRQLFRVDLRQPGVTPAPAERWVARGLRTVTSAPVRFDAAVAVPVGRPGWYLTRPGFAHGGIGVAACWFGGAVGVVTRLHARAANKGGDLDLAHLGAADVALHGARAALLDAAGHVDAGAPAGELLALRVRSVVADAVERVLRHAGHALGPTPLAFDADHAARVADLELYVRQHHAERDLAALGRLLVDPANDSDDSDDA